MGPPVQRQIMTLTCFLFFLLAVCVENGKSFHSSSSGMLNLSRKNINKSTQTFSRYGFILDKDFCSRLSSTAGVEQVTSYSAQLDVPALVAFSVCSFVGAAFWVVLSNAEAKQEARIEIERVKKDIKLKEIMGQDASESKIRLEALKERASREFYLGGVRLRFIGESDNEKKENQ
mmetsp:Transcript_14302/g.21037  ORF Transcript_14302/g.21037 Transcript_14302/m.21037 type:complete len:175 (-) Transcript_14302:33-557(-)